MKKGVIAFAVLALWLVAYWIHSMAESGNIDVPWQKIISPGPLALAHSDLENDCHNCHTAIKGIEREKCVLCHANEATLLGRQPTAFHAEIEQCSGCHREHQGRDANLNAMDHKYLARTLRNQLDKGDRLARNRVDAIIHSTEMHETALMRSRGLSAEAISLDCAACHRFEEPHFGYMGTDCVQCHNLDQWTIDAYQHPSSTSTECEQCHQAPPSHYMEHFKMISQAAAREPHAPVEACFECHQTTSWNDIKNIGYYKHH